MTANALITRALRLLAIVEAPTGATESITATAVVTIALKLLGVIEATETPQADDVTDGRVALNALLRHWPGTATFADGTTPVTVPAWWARAMPPVLALEIAPMYGVEPQPALVKQASEAWTDVQHRAVRDDEALGMLNALLDSSFPRPLTFATPTTDLTLDEGWTRAIASNLALELAPMYGAPVSPALREAAATSLATVRRLVWTPTDAAFDAGLTARGAYDILTDT